MEPLWIEALGIVAGSLTTAAYAPQVIKTWKSRSVRDISLHMYAVLSMGIALWIVYGLLVGSLAVIVANAASLALTLAMVFLKIRFS